MQYRQVLIIICCFLTGIVSQAQQPDRKMIRIVDTLTQQEKSNRNPVILRSEMDSLLKLHLEAIQPQLQQQPIEQETQQAETSPWMIAMLVALVIVILLLYLMLRNQERFRKTIGYLNRQVSQLEFAMVSADKKTDGKRNMQSKSRPDVTEASTEKLQEEIKRLEGLLKGYSVAKEEYEGLKQRIISVYKIRNYPGYDNTKTEATILNGMLDTERSIALYAYDHFLKPVIQIADANKNNPAKISQEDSEKLLQLLLSLSLLYTEYLYLRVNELSIGGKMVERIKGFSNGNGLDLSLLKELNTEHGSRALVLRMALDKMNVRQLAYPVFDETNLNLS